MLKQTDAEIIIDRKDFSGDKFDDLKVKTPNGTTEFQIKYSDDEYSHKLAKDDFANGNGHDTALCDLFASWKTRKESENDTQIKLCLAWNRPDDDDPIVEFLKPIQEQALPFSIVAYSFDGEVFWPVGNLPPKTWRKFNLAVKSGLIDREAFLSFCNELTIILEMPKASLDLKNPGGIENVIIRQAEKLGVGIYPNDNLNLEEVIYKLATEVKRSRAMGNRLYINTLMGRLGFIRDYGKFDQRFPVDSAHKVMLDDEIESLHRAIRDSKRVIITGNPGSGKSWLVDEYIDKLENDDSKVIHYNCFQSLQDTNSLERIRVTSLYGNLVSQIVEQYPELVEHKNTTLGADKAELENLLRLIGGEFYLVVDGLDHISREYDLHKDLISRSETEIISELLEIHFPDNCYVTIASQPIDALDEFKANTFYSELPEVIISHSGRITKGLLDALFAFEYDKDIIVEIWRNVFDIMKLRFPNLDQYTSDNIFEETDELLELRNCLLMRFIDGGKESFLATYAYLANAAEKEKFSEFTESIVFCLEHYEQYNLVTQIAIADLVRCYGWCLKDMNIDRMISAINVVYPTGNLLLDVIFSEFTVYNSYLLMCSDKHAPDYMEQEDVEFYLAEQLYDLGKEEVQEGTDEYAENSVYRDPIMQVLDTSGINYIEIYKKLHASRRLNDKMQDFVGGASKILETNTVYKSYVIQYALHAIIEKAFIDREPELLPQTLFRLIPDYQGMYKLFKCRDMQPQNHLYDKNNSCEPFLINNKDEYILIGCSEIKKHIDYHQTSLIFAYQGIVGEAGDEHQIPFQQYLATAVEEGEIYTILDNPESLIDFIRTLDRELEDEDYLWPGTSVSKLLDVHIEFDFLNGRYIAINQEKDVVFIMKKWSSSYKGDSEYHGNAIPLYSGTKLYIKKEYIGILEQQFGTLMMKTCVQSYTQDY